MADPYVSNIKLELEATEEKTIQQEPPVRHSLLERLRDQPDEACLYEASGVLSRVTIILRCMNLGEVD